MLEAEVAVSSLDAVQDLLAGWWDEVGGSSARERFAFELAVVEIAGNIIEHSERLDGAAGRRFTLELVADADRLRATFEDDGRPAVLDLSAVVMADDEAESGRGLALSTASLDRLDYRFEHGRNVWELESRRG
jgi:serine/threonine-protein kinase RsbW